MLNRLKGLFTENIALKLTSLVLALALWFYIVDALNKGSEEERKFLNKVLPSEGLAARKLPIRPVFIGTPHRGYIVDQKKVIVVPEFCIVVGTRELIGKLRYSYTMPIDVREAYKPFTTAVALNPIAPGIFMEETLVQVTVPVERAK